MHLRIAFFCCLVCLGNVLPSLAQSPAASPAPAVEMELVLRISEQYLRSLARTDVTFSFPIQRVADGVPVTGQVEAIGVTDLEIAPSDRSAEFVLMVKGDATSRFAAKARPATLFASSNTHFDARKKIAFDGKHFQQASAMADTKTCTHINRICPKHKGLIGGVVKKVARKVVDKNLVEINTAVDQAAQQYVVDTFEESATEYLKRLDEFAAFEASADTMLKGSPELDNAEYHLQADLHSLYVGIGKPEAVFRSFPAAKAPVELWVRTKPEEEVVIQLMVDWNLVHDALREYLPEDLAKEVSEDLTVEVLGGWTALRIGGPRNESERSSAK